MSVDLYVLFDQPMPSLQRLQTQIQESGLDVTLQPDIDLSKASGFVPAAVNGRRSGFYFSFGDAEGCRPAAGGGDGPLPWREWRYCASFSYGGHFDEMTAATAASASLARLANGVLADPQEGKLYKGAQIDNYVLILKDFIHANPSLVP